ncbi:ROK family transcriptional regulator [Streptomyces sp. NPDC002265]|uniref:ROK family transcriptional regulator n=1 Tax=Streptomyces sp. NPDC002265 TaxID=3154415 RepID=UPI003329774B
MTPTKPSLDLLRALTDENVLRALMDHRRLTRAEIAAHTGISKPTIYEAVGRLEESGLVVDTGERTTGRGRVGSYYALAGHGRALVASITPHGVVTEAVDAYGTGHGRHTVPLDPAPGPDVAASALARAAAAVAAADAGALRVAVVSAADPVDRATGRLVHLPDAPFLVGELDPSEILAPQVTGPVLVDNDVNWAARAEHRCGVAQGVDDFFYLHLGEGLGGAVVSDGVVRRGHRGLVGETAHLTTVGPDGRAMPLTEVFAALGLRRPASTAIDADAVREALSGDGARAERTLDALARAVGGVLAAAVSLADPRLIVVGGGWGLRPDVITAIDEHFTRSPRPVPVVAATVDEPELAGARVRAVEELRSLIIRSAHPERP